MCLLASGGAGCIDHIAQALDSSVTGGHASAALLASLLHDGVLTVEEIKADLLGRGLTIRPWSRGRALLNLPLQLYSFRYRPVLALDQSHSPVLAEPSFLWCWRW